jgi:hypothetical protein
VHAAPQQQAREGRETVQVRRAAMLAARAVDYVGAGLADLHRVAQAGLGVGELARPIGRGDGDEQVRVRGITIWSASSTVIPRARP